MVVFIEFFMCPKELIEIFHIMHLPHLLIRRHRTIYDQFKTAHTANYKIFTVVMKSAKKH